MGVLRSAFWKGGPPVSFGLCISMFQVTSLLELGLFGLRVLSLLSFKGKLILIELDPNQEWGILYTKKHPSPKKTALNVRPKPYPLFPIFYYKMFTFCLNKMSVLTYLYCNIRWSLHSSSLRWVLHTVITGQLLLLALAIVTYERWGSRLKIMILVCS